MDRARERDDSDGDAAAGEGRFSADDLARSGDVLGGSDLLGRALDRWAADAAIDEAARARARARWLQVQADESASVVGTLIDLAERARPVVLDVAGHRVRGVVVGVGGDFVALRSDGRQQVLVRTSTIGIVRAEPGTTEVAGERSALLDVTLTAVLGPMAAERPEVLVRTVAGASIRGELRAAGTDVLRIRSDGDASAPAWVPIDAVAVLVLHP